MNHLAKGMWNMAVVAVVISVFLVTASRAAKEKVIVAGNISALQTIDPAMSALSSTTNLVRNIFQGLLRYKYNASPEVEGDLAESWSVSEDGKVYTFKLRDGIRWHKGFGKVTANDVKFSFDRVLDRATKARFRSDVAGSVKEVKVIDELTVEIHLKTRDAAFLHKCVRPKPVAIVCQKAVEKYGKEFARNPVGSGPFVFESMTREQTVLVANKDYHEGPPKIDRVICKIIPDVDTLMLALIKGEIDIAWTVPREQVVIDRAVAAGCKMKVVNRGAFQYFLINHRMKPFGDIRIRRAMAHAIDREKILQHVIGGYGDIWNSHVPIGYFGYNPDGLRRYAYDPEKAKKLLAEAGYPNGFEAVFQAHTQLSCGPPSIAVQAELAKVGIRLKMDISDNPSTMKKVTSGQATLFLYTAGRPPDADIPLTNFLHGGSASPGTNLSGYNKLDKEIEEARAEMDPKRRLEIYHNIQKVLMEDLPVIPMHVYHYPAVFQPYVVGLPDRDPIWGVDYYHMDIVGKK